MRAKLFIPGPTEVSQEVLDAMAEPMIGHRGKDFQELYARLQPKLRRMFHTDQEVLLFTSSSTGAMEAAIRNCVSKRVLNLVCGAFGDRWHEIALMNGKQADKLEVPWGQATTSEMVSEALSKTEYDAITLIHNETSTGVMNPLEAIARVVHEHPDVMFLVDTVSSMGGVKIEVDRLGLDVCLAGTQKAIGLPPGLALCSVSQRALEKARTVPDRGFYFDFLETKKQAEKSQTPSTPSISHMFALDRQMDRILDEGLENRYDRHKKMASIVQEWGARRFGLFAQEGYRSTTVTTVSNTKNIEVAMFISLLKKRGYEISSGYGKLKGQTFRIAHMGDVSVDELQMMLATANEVLG